MKLKKLESKHILKLYLLKYGTHEQTVLKNNVMNSDIEFTLNEIMLDFKKALQIVFQYHARNKQILFIGAPMNLESRINKTTRHVAISKNVNMHNLISNYSHENLAKSKLVNKQQINQFKPSLSKPLKRPDLIVIIEHETPGVICKECAIAKLPVVNFKTTNFSKSIWSMYSYNSQLISRNSNLGTNVNLLTVGLNFLFKISCIKNKKLMK